MAVKTETFPPPQIAQINLRDTLKKFGIAPIVLEHWVITVEENPVMWRYDVTLSWRNYRIRKCIDKDEVSLFNADALMLVGRLIAGELYRFNTAEDEEHMEALALLSMRPTNGLQNQQL